MYGGGIRIVCVVCRQSVMFPGRISRRPFVRVDRRISLFFGENISAVCERETVEEFTLHALLYM